MFCSKSAKTSKADSEDTESQEVLEERMMHFLSREHIEFIGMYCMFTKSTQQLKHSSNHASYVPDGSFDFDSLKEATHFI